MTFRNPGTEQLCGMDRKRAAPIASSLIALSLMGGFSCAGPDRQIKTNVVCEKRVVGSQVMAVTLEEQLSALKSLSEPRASLKHPLNAVTPSALARNAIVLDGVLEELRKDEPGELRDAFLDLSKGFWNDSMAKMLGVQHSIVKVLYGMAAAGVVFGENEAALRRVLSGIAAKSEDLDVVCDYGPIMKEVRGLLAILEKDRCIEVGKE